MNQARGRASGRRGNFSNPEYFCPSRGDPGVSGEGRGPGRCWRGFHQRGPSAAPSRPGPCSQEEPGGLRFPTKGLRCLPGPRPEGGLCVRARGERTELLLMISSRNRVNSGSVELGLRRNYLSSNYSKMKGNLVYKLQFLSTTGSRNESGINSFLLIVTE